MRQLFLSITCTAIVLGVFASPAQATWSICIADCNTREVAVGTVTCLEGFDLLAWVPVIVVEEGAAASQALIDSDGSRRKVIRKQIKFFNLPPEEIIELLSHISGHESRQYGIVDTECRSATFTGSETLDWAGGRTGQLGSKVYSIQGNILVGECVIQDIEDALVSVFNSGGDMPDMLMAGMEAAGATGGDGRCSCSPDDPTGCGCPVETFDKSGHIGGMIVSRVGDIEDDLCDVDGCADGEYVMRLNVAFQDGGDPEPVDQLRDLFDQWRTDLVDVTDAIHSTADFAPDQIPANGVSTTTLTINLLDWQDMPIGVAVDSVVVDHTDDSAGLSTIGAVQDQGGGVFAVTMTAGNDAGVDRFSVLVTEQGGRQVWLMPEPILEYNELGDIDGNGLIDFGDLVIILANWGDCPAPPESCPADLNGDGMVDFQDILVVLANWS